MGRKSDLLNAFRKAEKRGEFVGTFNEFTGGRFSEKGGDTAARLESKAIAEAGADLSAQIREAGGDPSRMSLEEMRILDANARAANFARAQTTSVIAGESAEDVANRANITLDNLLLQNPSTFGLTSPNSITGGADTSVFAGQQLNVSGLPPVQGPQQARDTPVANFTGAGGLQQFQPFRNQGMTVLEDAERSRLGGRGTTVPTASDFTARTQAQSTLRSTLTPTPSPGITRTRASFIGSDEALQATNETLKSATKSFTNKNGRLTQAQIDSIYDNVESSTSGTMEEILSRNAGDPDFQMDAMIDAFASPAFISVIEALQSGVPPTYIEQKAFNALTEGPHGLGMMDKETSDFLKKYYELRPLATGQGARGYWYVASSDPADTSAGGGASGTGGSSFVNTQGITRDINRLIRSVTPSPGGGGGGGGAVVALLNHQEEQEARIADLRQLVALLCGESDGRPS